VACCSPAPSRARSGKLIGPFAATGEPALWPEDGFRGPEPTLNNTMADPPLRSAVDGIAWPAVPEPRGAAVMAILFQLEQSQWWSPERLRARQMEQLALLLCHARRHVPFYRKRLEDFDLAADQIMLLDQWQGIALLQRAEIQAAGEDLVSKALPKSHGGCGEIFTSGSTGKPVRALRSRLWDLFWSAFTLRDHLWHRRDMTGRPTRRATRRPTGAAQAARPSRPDPRSA
jgi:phenylacetate-CoA ligase